MQPLDNVIEATYLQTKESKAGNKYKMLTLEVAGGEKIELLLDRGYIALLSSLSDQENKK